MRLDHLSGMQLSVGGGAGGTYGRPVMIHTRQRGDDLSWCVTYTSIQTHTHTKTHTPVWTLTHRVLCLLTLCRLKGKNSELSQSDTNQQSDNNV